MVMMNEVFVPAMLATVSQATPGRAGQQAPAVATNGQPEP